jgi:hypothetical protein
MAESFAAHDEAVFGAVGGTASVGNGATHSCENDTARPQRVMLVMDYLVDESDATPASQWAGDFRLEGSLTVTTYPIGTTPPEAAFRQIYQPLDPALTVALFSLMKTSVGVVTRSTLEGRAMGMLPDLEPGWGYYIRPSTTPLIDDTVQVSAPAGYAATVRLFWTCLQWSSLDGDE